LAAASCDSKVATLMDGVAALMLLFVWLKLGHVFDLSWWWIMTPPLVA
jgi:hypothetical protein